jgi:hypothetical protein
MKSVTKIGIAAIVTILAFGVGLSSVVAQTAPKLGTKGGSPPKNQVNSAAQTGTSTRTQTNSSNKTGTSAKTQVNRSNYISSAEMEHMQRLSSELGLNQSQFSQIVNIVNEANYSAYAVDSDTDLTQSQKHAKILAIARHKRSQIDAVLTPAERIKLQAIEKSA